MTSTSRRRLWLGLPLLVIVAALAARSWPGSIAATPLDLPSQLTNAEFWSLVQDFSEPNGFFRSDNLVSNETTFQQVIPRLTRRVAPGGIYMGVGPDQNFTYIAALRPRLAFIPDIRRGNLHAHLMYKALFELSEDRAAFLSRLFSRPRPSGMGAEASVGVLFTAYAAVPPDRQLYAANFEEVRAHLTGAREFPLTAEDLAGIDYVYRSFYAAGPSLTYASTGRGFGRSMRYPSFEELQTATDADGIHHAYLADEARYQYVRRLQQENLIVPIVGDFGGPKAIRAVAGYLRARGATVTAFYTSNVEQYLFQDGIWDRFANNVMTLPLDETSTFIRSCFHLCAASYGRERSVTMLDSMPSLMRDFALGRVTSYWDVLSHSD
jgi:hypothetical protein